MPFINLVNIASFVIALFICISVIALVFVQKKMNKILLILPFFNFILISLLQIIYIIWSRPYSSKGETISEIFRLYFINDSVMVFVFCYIPSIIVGTIIPILVIVIFALRQKLLN